MGECVMDEDAMDENALKKICIFLPSLEKGGAERRMSLLAIKLKQRGYHVDIMVLRRKGEFLDIASEHDVTIYSVDKGGRFDVLGAALRTISIFRQNNYDVLLSCLPSANLFSVLVKLLRRRRRTQLIWGIAAADMPMQKYGLWAKMGAKMQKSLSGFADAIVVNSFFGEQILRQQGYSRLSSKALSRVPIIVIQNGVDTHCFKVNRKAGQQWREQHAIALDAKLIGMVARLDPAKGIETFLQAIDIAEKYNQAVGKQRTHKQQEHKKQAQWHFVIFGSGKSDYADQLKQTIESHELYEKRLFLFENADIDKVIYNAMDMLSITSVSESFPNVMLEAMSCGTPLVSTDVGDCKMVIQDFGKVIDVGDAQGLYEAWKAELEINNNITRADAMNDYVASSEYVANHFSIDHMVDKFESLIIDSFQKSRMNIQPADGHNHEKNP